jgi:hypothetical protein
MHGPIDVKSPNNTSKWQVGFNSAFKGLMLYDESPTIFKEFQYWAVSIIIFAYHAFTGTVAEVL